MKFLSRLFRTRYRIVQEQDDRYSAHGRPWWCPFWLSCGGGGGWLSYANSFSSAYLAAKEIDAHKKTRNRQTVVVWQE